MTIRWILLSIVLVACLTSVHCACIFDAIKSSDVALTKVNYAHHRAINFTEGGRLRAKRDLSIDDFFKPIRVSTFFFKMELEDSEKEKLKTVIYQAVSLIDNILSVLPVDGTLLLNRTGCRYTWADGINVGKCGFAVRNYRGEFCADLQIPDEHLDEFSLWNSGDREPKAVLNPRGPGVNNTDFILYVQSVSSSQCTSGELNIIAYATYCRLDQNSRPVAGYINICPNMIRQNGFDGAKISITVLHELFHALGFSSDLFGSFKECFLTGNYSVTCRPLLRTIRTVRDARRLVTNRVSELASRHFGCNGSINDFGPILQTEGNVVKSHWDAAFMQGSLMTPTISQPHLTFLDPMTLAVFEDSGWYRVNYAYAQEYYWGKGQGCDFGLHSSCDQTDSSYFCQQYNSLGCHFLHRDKGTCISNPFLHGCKIYDSQLKDSCNLPLEFNKDNGGFGESFGESSGCFFSNLTRVSGDELPSTTDLHLVGRCYPHLCNATGHVFVRVEDNWIHCPEGNFIQVPDLIGVVKCPMAEILCNETQPLFDDVTLGTSITGSDFTTPDYNGNLVDIEMEFYSLPAFAQQSSQLIEMLTDQVKYTIQLNTDVPIEGISNMTVLWSQDIIRFTLQRSPQSSIDGTLKESPQKFMETLSKVVNAGNFSISLSGSTYKAKAVRQLSVSTTPHQHDLSTVVSSVLHSVPSHSGIVLVIVLTSIIAVVIILVVATLVLRFCFLVRRSEESQDPPVDSTISTA